MGEIKSMNYFEFLGNKYALSNAIQPNINLDNLRLDENMDNPFKLNGESIFTNATKKELKKLDYEKLVEDEPKTEDEKSEEKTDKKADEEKKFSPLEFILKEFLSLDKVKTSADKDSDGKLTVEEIKEYVTGLAKKDGKSDLSLEDFNAVIEELEINLDELLEELKPKEDAEGTQNQEETPAAEETPTSSSVDDTSSASSDSGSSYSEPVQSGSSTPVASSSPVEDSPAPARSSHSSSAGESSAPEVKTIDNMSLEELQAEKTTRQNTLSEKQKAVNAVRNGENANVKAAKTEEAKAKEEYEKAIKEDDAAKKFANDILKNNEALEKNKTALDKNAENITNKEEEISKAEASITEKESELSGLEASLKSLSSAKEDDENAKKQKADLTKKISALKKEISNDKKQLEKLKKDLESLNKEKTKLEEEKKKLEEEKTKLDEKVKENCSETTKAKLEAYNKARENVEKVKSKELATANKEYKEAQESLKEINAKIAEAKKNKVTDTTTAPKGSVEKMVQIAEQEYKKGVKETSKNDSVDIRRYKHGAKNTHEWCAYFTSYCAEQAGLTDKTFKYTPSSQAIRRAAEKAGKFSSKNSSYNPKRGDVAIWTNIGDPNHGHVGIVDKIYKDGSIDIIEGNSHSAVSKNHYASKKIPGRFNGYIRMNEWVA